MLTSHPRHSITERPVRAALEELHSRGGRSRFGDLIIRGAQERLREIKEERDEETRKLELRRDLAPRAAYRRGS